MLPGLFKLLLLPAINQSWIGMSFISAAGASLKSQLWNSGKIDLVCEMGSGRARSVQGGLNPPPSARTLEMSLLSQHNDICLAGEIILLFCPGSKGHGCGPENKPLRISETTLTYDGEKERERYSMPLAPCCEIAQRQSKISMADKEGRKTSKASRRPLVLKWRPSARMRASRRLHS